MTNYDALLAREVDSAESWATICHLLPNAHPLQSWAWGSIKSRWGWSMHPTVWELNGKPQAAAMLLRRAIPKTPFGILYAPKGPFLDYDNVPLRQAVWRRLQGLARAEKAIFIKLDADIVKGTGVEFEPHALGQTVQSELVANGWQFADDQIQFRNTVMLDLTKSEDDLLAAMKSKTRYNIRLAAKKGIEVRVGTPADFDTISAMYATTSERNEFAIRPKAYYRDVWQTLYDDGMLHPLIAEYEGQAIAAIMLVHSGDLVMYMYGASTNIERKRMPTYLLQWEAIKWAQAQGYKQYDFWGAPDEFVEGDRLWGVWRFKSGFNGTVTHHIGAWDYAAYPLLHKLYAEALPRYMDLLRSRAG